MKTRDTSPARPERRLRDHGVVSNAQAVRNDDIFADGLLSVQEACLWLRCKKTALYKLMKTTVPWTRVAGRRKIPKRALVDLAAVGLVRPRRRGADGADIS